MNGSGEVVIVGAGPAGMSAAITLAECGVKSVVLDGQPAAGGQIYRQPADTLRLNGRDRFQSPDAKRILAAFHSYQDQITFLPGTRVWGVFEERQLAIQDATRCNFVQAEQLLIATGAYEFVPPFPGWTLPGVMTPGAAQVLVKSTFIRPSGPVVVAGTGPFLLVVACALLDAGAEVVAVVESARQLDVIKRLPKLLTNLSLVRQGWRYLRKLRKAGVPIHTGHLVVSASGDDQLEKVTYAPCNSDWQPNPAKAQSIHATTLCVGYGFVPRTDLAQMAGCEMQWNDLLGGWIPVADQDLRTTQPGVWVAGDGAGVAGALSAETEGRLAGYCMAHTRGAISGSELERLRRPVERQLSRLSRFRQSLDEVSRIRPGLLNLISPETVVCRCEELTRGEVDTAIQAGSTTNRTIKVATRLGMGPCQGRMCWPAMSRYLAAKCDRPIQEVGQRSVRPPVEPLTIDDLAHDSAEPTGEATH